MATKFTSEQTAAVTLLLQAGKTIKEISAFADLDRASVTEVARELDIEPATAPQRRAKALFVSSDGVTYQEIAKTLDAEGLGDGDGPTHHLTIAKWARDYGWRWGGSDDGRYAPDRAAIAPARTRYTLRLSKGLDAEINAPAAISAAAKAAYDELTSDRTRVLAVAIVKGAAQSGVTDLAAVKKQLLDTHGDEIRSARA